MSMQREYEALLDAAQALQTAREAITKQELNKSFLSPAWRIVKHAQDHVLALADRAVRIEWGE
jgi:hypothetical protein